MSSRADDEVAIVGYTSGTTGWQAPDGTGGRGLGELHATLAAQNVPAGGPAGGIFTDEVFTRHRGQVIIYVPCPEHVRPMGRVTSLLVPAAELAVIEHRGRRPDP
jgi:hypothetical protein